MPNGYYPAERVLNKDDGVTLGASVTKQAVSHPFAITAGGSLHLRIEITASSATVADGITAYFQHAVPNVAAQFTDVKSVSITGNGRFDIIMNVEVAADQAYTPLKSTGRVVVTTGVGDAVTIDNVKVLQEL